MPSLFVDTTTEPNTTFVVVNGRSSFQQQQNFAGHSYAIVEDQTTIGPNTIGQLAAELSAKFNFDGSTGNSLDSRSTCSDPGYPDPSYIMQIAAAAAQRKSQNTTECVPVPSSEHVAEIVGRQGCKIKALRAKTNTYIKTPVRGEEPVFVVSGRKEDIELAKLEILSAADHFTQIRASRRHSQGGIPAPGHITAYVRVPYKFVGLVVGPKGATIKRIQQQTHTYIITPSRDKEPIFEVTGLSENVESARNEIEMHIVSRTGTFLTSAAAGGGEGMDEKELLEPDDFRMNGTDIALENEFDAANLYNGAFLTDDAASLFQRQLSNNNNNNNTAICKPLLKQFRSLPFGDSTNIQQTGRNFLSASSQVQIKYNGAWSTNDVSCSNNTVHSTSSDQDEGVWSTAGESPNSLSIEALFPSYLSSIWSDLDCKEKEDFIINAAPIGSRRV